MIESSLRNAYPELFSFIDRGECGIGYSPKVREFHLKVRRGSAAVQLLSFCPFTGRKLPSSLRTPFFDELDRIGLNDGLTDVDRAPMQFQSERWWLDRGL
ncbi:hypothetical protein [Brevundimonas sp. NIBR11]|uniref:DUF6980 family protein n=1 Tax=Brevundimonas sp. NIBR11 TaxID=3015999 RepID=UPI0022F0014A|nr:hypothetical protein [Brevundimonas sp. NIBR11]